MTVVLNLPPSPGFQRKTVKGRAHVPQERPYSCFDYGDELGKALKEMKTVRCTIRMKGLEPRPGYALAP